MRRSRLRARKSLRRRKRVNPRRATPRRSHAVKDESFKAAVRLLPCCARYMGPCRGHVDPHHAGDDRGLGQKASDDTCIPMCRKHHTEIEDVTGAFKGWIKEMLRSWQDEKIAATRATVGEARAAA